MTINTPTRLSRRSARRSARSATLFRRAVADAFSAWGYDRIETPVVEHFGTFEAAAGDLEGTAFRLVDLDGRLLALRPDMTVPIARLVASRLAGEPGPHCVCYVAEVFREHESLRGQARQFSQVGVELVGARGPAADAEVVAVLVEALTAAGLGDFTVAIGTVAVLRALLAAAKAAPALSDEVVLARHTSATSWRIDRLSEHRGAAARAACALSACRASAAAARRSTGAGSCSRGSAAARRLDELAETWELLEHTGAAERVPRRLSASCASSTTTPGSSLEAYAPRSGRAARRRRPLRRRARGVRHAGACGWLRARARAAAHRACRAGRCQSRQRRGPRGGDRRRLAARASRAGWRVASARRARARRASTPPRRPPSMARSCAATARSPRCRTATGRPATCVVPQGRAVSTTARPAAAHRRPQGRAVRRTSAARRRRARHDGSRPGRQLIVRAEWSTSSRKPTDIPVYVAYGAADCGIAGKDVLVEAGLDVVELVDLRFGGVPLRRRRARGRRPTLTERLRHLGVVRVATKYPNITEAHFADAGVQVEIVKLQRQHRARAAHRHRRRHRRHHGDRHDASRRTGCASSRRSCRAPRASSANPASRAHRLARARACRHAVSARVG